MESIRYTEIAVLEDVKKGIEFYRKYGVLPEEDLKDCIRCNVKGTVVTPAFFSKVNYLSLL